MAGLLTASKIADGQVAAPRDVNFFLRVFQWKSTDCKPVKELIALRGGWSQMNAFKILLTWTIQSA